MAPIAVTTKNGEVGSGPFALAANTEQVVNFDDDVLAVEVGVKDATDMVWFTVDGTEPVVGGNKHSYPLVPGTNTGTPDVPTQGPATVRIITAGTAPTAWVVAST